MRNVRTCIHAYTHTCTHAYMHAYMHTRIHAYIHTSIHAYVHTYAHAYRVNACMHKCRHTPFEATAAIQCCMRGLASRGQPPHPPTYYNFITLNGVCACTLLFTYICCRHMCLQSKRVCLHCIIYTHLLQARVPAI